MLSITAIVWISFLLLVGGVVALDLGVFHRKSHIVSLPEALGWTVLWMTLALLFTIGVYYLYELNPAGWDIDTSQLDGREAAVQFFTGYVIEKSLSIDNIFVIAMIFTYMKVPATEQHRVLYWGIIGAIVLRGLLIVSGVELIERYEWLTYVLGAFLIVSAARLLVVRHDNVDVANGTTMRMIRRFVPVTESYHGNRFVVRENGRRTATPLLVALILVETSDVMFAVDSIPAILAISRDPFIVFTSNIFALLGLRSLFFVLAGLMDRFRYIKNSLVYLLAFVGVKMLLAHVYPIPNIVSLCVIGGILSVGMLASTNAGRDTIALLSPLADNLEELFAPSYRQAWRAVILFIGCTVLLVGALAILLPVPAMGPMLVGIIMLGAEIAWARAWLSRIKRSARARSSEPGT